MYKESNKTTIYAKGRAISLFFQGMSSFYKVSLPLGTNSGAPRNEPETPALDKWKWSKLSRHLLNPLVQKMLFPYFNQYHNKELNWKIAVLLVRKRNFISTALEIYFIPGIDCG